MGKWYTEGEAILNESGDVLMDCGDVSVAQMLSRDHNADLYENLWYDVFTSALQGSAILDQNDKNVTPEKLVQNAKNIADAAVENNDG